MLSRRDLGRGLFATAIGLMVGRWDNQLSSLTALDILERYPEVRHQVGDLSWMQLHHLVKAIGVHCKDHPGEWTPQNVTNINLFMHDHVNAKYKGMMITLFSAIMTTREMANIVTWHRNYDVMGVVEVCNKFNKECRMNRDIHEDAWGTILVAEGGDPDMYPNAGKPRVTRAYFG